MKKSILFSFVILFLGIKAHGQQALAVAETTFQQPAKVEYLNKSKTLKRVGWISLGVGVPAVLIGQLVSIAGIESANWENTEKTGNWITYSGVALAVASIPCFVISHHYKRRAASISLKNQQIVTPQQHGFSSSFA